MSDALEFIRVNDEVLAKSVESLAQEIWTEHYVPIVGKPQVDYMLKTFQSKDSIMRQLLQENFQYYLIKRGEDLIGYIGMVPKDQDALFLSKFYLRACDRGQGYGKLMTYFVETKAREMGFTRIRLTVNKNNTGSVSAYLKMGFKTVGPMIQDIGAGFFMDDYVMEKVL